MRIKPIVRIPLVILRKIINRIQIEINEIKFPESARYYKLLQSYRSIGLSGERGEYIEILNGCLDSLGFPRYDEDQGMYSEHLIIFAALSKLSSDLNNILEIGTYDGRTSSILARLFPESNITTIDLKDDDPIFESTYNREMHLDEFIRTRNILINKHENIRFIQANSLYLTFSKALLNQDLIWVDGAHGYPIATTDIANSLRLLSREGILMCDDVWKKKRNSDQMYASIASFETLSSYCNASIIEATFFPKRIGKRYNGNYKFVSFSKLSNNFDSEID